MFQSPQFSSPVGLGRTALTSFCLGVVMSCALCTLMFCWIGGFSFTTDCTSLVIQYALYWVVLTFFHFSEFLLTAAFKPGFVNYDCTYYISKKCRYQLQLTSLSFSHQSQQALHDCVRCVPCGILDPSLLLSFLQRQPHRNSSRTCSHLHRSLLSDRSDVDSQIQFLSCD